MNRKYFSNVIRKPDGFYLPLNEVNEYLGDKFLVTADLKNENSIIDRGNNTYLYEITNTVNTENGISLLFADDKPEWVEGIPDWQVRRLLISAARML